MRRHLPDERESITHKFDIYGTDSDGNPKKYEGYVTVGLYDTGEPGEIFIRFDKMGGREGMLLDAWAILVSICLQSGISLRTIVDKFSFQRFEPAGFTGKLPIKSCTSPLDYVVRWLDFKFGGEVNEDETNILDGK